MSHVGASLKRLDDPRLLTGRGCYVDDLALPRMAHVAFVRSPHAHAEIAAVDVSVAAQSTGVVGILTGTDAARLCKAYRGILQHYRGMKTGAMRSLAVDRVRCVGEPVVAIAAETAAAAHDAAARVRVEPDTAFAAAPRVWRRRFSTTRQTGVPIEPRGLVAEFEPATRGHVPALDLHHPETPAPSIAGGYKGAGEAGTTGAPAAILNAVNDALAPFGAAITDQPITPERIVRALRESRGRP